VKRLKKISELKLGMTDIEVKGNIVDISEPRDVRTKFGYTTRVATATLEDDSGKILLPLWGTKIKEVNAGDTVEVKGGYVSEFRGDLQLNVPRKGEIKIV